MRHILILIFSLTVGVSSSNATIKIVASFSILADLVKQIGGEHVYVENIVGPNEDAHVFNPAPKHSIMLATADVVIVNGLGFEGWIDRLITASGFKGHKIIASKGVMAIKSGDLAQDPHAWHSIPNVMKYVEAISADLQKIDPKHAKDFQKNATRYKQRLRLLDEWVRDEVSRIAVKNRKIITAHDAFQYFAKEYKINFLAPMGISTQAEANPEVIKNLINLIKNEGIKIIFVENITNEKHMNMIHESTGARIGGTLYSDALSTDDGPAADYISMIRHNVSLLLTAMSI